jgi:hypothetical protein
MTTRLTANRLAAASPDEENFITIKSSSLLLSDLGAMHVPSSCRSHSRQKGRDAAGSFRIKREAQ